MNTGSLRPSGTATATLFDGLALPMLPAHRTPPSRLWKECRTAFRETLRFIVMSVITVIRGTFPDTYRVIYMTVN